MHPKIKRMVKLMEAKAAGAVAKKKKKRKKEDPWFLYILRCHDGTFYTGVTKDIERRVRMHNAGKASKYTRIRRPIVLMYQENCRSRAEALTREYQVKELPRNKKEELICQKP